MTVCTGRRVRLKVAHPPLPLGLRTEEGARGFASLRGCVAPVGFTPKPPEAFWALLAGHAYPLSKWKDDFGAGKWVPGLLGDFEKGLFEWSSSIKPFVGPKNPGLWPAHRGLAQPGSSSLPVVLGLAVRGHRPHCPKLCVPLEADMDPQHWGHCGTGVLSTHCDSLWCGTHLPLVRSWRQHRAPPGIAEALAWEVPQCPYL